MCPACLRGFMTAGPDVVRGSGPNHFHGLDTHDPEAGSPDRQIDRLTSRHHHPRNWIFVPALPQTPIADPSGGSRKRRRPVDSTFVHYRPCDACRLVGNGDRNKLGRLFGEQLGDPAMLVRMTPGVLHDWTQSAPAFAALNPSLGQVYFNIATASIIANALAN
jgi:hypothetical protein